MFYDFETKAYGKWILAGEHAVLRGHPALVFPLKNKTLTLKYKRSDAPLTLHYQGEAEKHCETAIWQLIHKGFETLALDFEDQMKGELLITNQVPIGTGLGASAALSVAITRWLKAIFTPEITFFEFARTLEHIFHGQSSGLDIAGSASSSEAVYFKSGHIMPFTPSWIPHFGLSFSGAASVTSQCITMVNALKTKNQAYADNIDKKMAISVKKAHEALLNKKQDTKLLLIEAIRSASDCFEAWGLINPPLKNHIDTLYQQGALAVKPTGSGNGGYVLSLWNHKPPSNFINLLI